MSDSLQALHDFPLSPAGYWWLVAVAVILGGAVGSFLNVVAYRLPLGMSLNYPGSRCPKCEQPIRWHHNLPVLGWLILRGRCRDCGAPISPRYPLVELAVALASGLVMARAIAPDWIDGQEAYVVNLLAVALRLVLVYLLFTVALLEFDGHHLPLRLIAVCLLMILGGMALVPELRPAQYLADQPIPTLDGLVAVCGVAAVFALILWPLLLLPPAGSPQDALAKALLLLLAAPMLGWIALLPALLLACTIRVCIVGLEAAWRAPARMGWSAAMLIVTLLFVLLAGEALGTNQNLRIGDSFSRVSNLWVASVLTGLVLALGTVVGRTIHAIAARRGARPFSNPGAKPL